MKTELQRVNRIYASKTAPRARIYKTGLRADKRTGEMKPVGVSLADCPPRPYVDNAGTISIEDIDKQYYIDLAYKRIDKFLGINKKEKKMTTKKTTADVEQYAVAPTPVCAGGIEEKVMRFFMDVASEAFPTDGYNSNQKYDYTKSATYKAVMRKYLFIHGLLFQMTDLSVNMESLNKSDKMNLLTYIGQIALTDVVTKEKLVWTVMAQGSDMGDKGISKAKTLAIKDWIKANALVYDGQDEPEASSEVNTTGSGVTLNTSSSAVRSASEKEAIKRDVVSNEKATLEEVREVEDIIDRIRDATGTDYGASTISKLYDANKNVAIGKGELEVIRAKVELKAESLGISL